MHLRHSPRECDSGWDHKANCFKILLSSCFCLPLESNRLVVGSSCSSSCSQWLNKSTTLLVPSSVSKCLLAIYWYLDWKSPPIYLLTIEYTRTGYRPNASSTWLEEEDSCGSGCHYISVRLLIKQLSCLECQSSRNVAIERREVPSQFPLPSNYISCYLMKEKEREIE